MHDNLLENFTYKASSVINRAFSIAGELGHTYIGSEHILLGILDEGTSTAYIILQKNGRITSYNVCYTKLLRPKINY